MAKRKTQGSEFPALDPELASQLRAELDRARGEQDEIDSARAEIEPTYNEMISRMSDLEDREEVLVPHIEALEVLLGERPFTRPGGPARSRSELEFGKRRIENILRPKPSLPEMPIVPRSLGLAFRRRSPEVIRQEGADLVVALLEETGEPLHYRDIHQELETRGYRVGGVDPAATLLSRFFKDPRLYRPQRGTYALVEWLEREDEQSADDLPDAADRLVALRRLMRGDKSQLLPDRDVLGAAERALRKEGKEMHHLDLTDKMIKMGKWRPIKSTPKNVVSLRLAKDIRDNRAGSRFRRFARGVYGLREWGDDGYAASELDTEGDEHE